MTGEHPVEAHTYQLNDHERRIRELEESVTDIQIQMSAADEKTKTVFKVLDELKSLLEKYTTEMRKAMAELGLAFNKRMDSLEQDVKDLQGRSGRKWDAAMQAVVVAIIGVVVGYFFGKVLP